MRAGRLNWTGVRGRNGGDSPLALPDWQAAEAVNIDFYRGELGAKRGGSVAVALTSGPSGSELIRSAIRHVPGNDETAAELWVFTDTPAAYRLTGGTTWATVTISDTMATGGIVSGATLNGKLFLAYDSNVNRLHVWDGTRMRRVGMAQGGTPSAANTGGGAYAATLRYYKVAWVEKNGTVIVRRGELGPSLSFTPSGAGTAARVTQPSVPSENETHWEIYASADDVYSNYKLIGTVVVGTTTYDDSVNPASYVGDAPQIAGLNIPPPSAKYLASEGNRLLMASAYETTAAAGQTAPKNNRVWHTRVLGSSDQGDDETIPNTSAVGITPAQKNWTDIGENDGGAITGLGVIESVPFPFKQRHVWMMQPTGDDLQPYRARNLTRSAGVLSGRSIVSAEDEAGATSLYFMDRRGPYRIGTSSGLQYLGRDVEDICSTIKPGSIASTWGLSYAAKHQVWFCIFLSAGATSTPVLLVFDTLLGRPGELGVRGGWARWPFPTDAAFINPLCGVPFSTTLGASMSTDMKPYIAGSTSAPVPVVRKYDTGTDDADTPYQAYIDSKPFFPAGIGVNCRTEDAVLIAEDAAGVSIQLTTTQDFGIDSRTSDVVLTPANSETHVIKRFEASGLAELGAVQFRLGDAAAVSNAWTLEALSVPFSVQESRS